MFGLLRNSLTARRGHRRCFRAARAAALVLPAVFLCGPATAGAADWPQWRHDAARSATSPQQLPKQLHLQWIRKLPALKPAWPDAPLLWFDTVYRPVVAGKTLFVASPRTGAITAYDVKTGVEKQRFYAEGPVRLPPVVWKDRLFFACDDGCLYCLNAGDLTLRWKFRGAPYERRVWGNKYLISSWPARGGPVLADGKVYFTAGIWPFMGTFFYAVDAASGKVVWTNDGLAPRRLTRPHNSPAFSGLAPQGCLAVSGDRLLIPNSRSVPGALDRNTGKLLFYHVSASHWSGRGGADIAAATCCYFNAGYIYDQRDGARLGGRSASGVLPAATTPVVFAFGKEGLSAYAVPKTKKLTEEEEDEDQHPHLSKLWTLPVPWKVTAMIAAGSRLYLGAPGLTSTVELPQKAADQPRLGPRLKVEGTPKELVAAADRLFVVTREGSIYCFGGTKSPPKTYEFHRARPAAAAATAVAAAAANADVWSKKAAEILKEAGNPREGICLVFGTGNGRLLEALARRSSLPVTAVEPDAAKAAAVRVKLDKAGLYGPRVFVLTGNPATFELPPYLASLLVVDDLKAAGWKEGSTAAFLKRIFHALRPYGGAACFPALPREQADIFKAATRKGLPNSETTRVGNYVWLRRVGPLPGSAPWTHQYADAANSCCSKDRLVKLPLGVLWFGNSSNKKILPRHGHGPSEQIVGGRLFIEGPNHLRALDVYTGRVLWERELPGLGKAYDETDHQPGANALGSNYASATDGIYVAYGRRGLWLNPATGKTLREFALPAAPSGKAPLRWSCLFIWKDFMVVCAEPLTFQGSKSKRRGRRRRRTQSWNGTASRRLFGLNRKTGKVLWSRTAGQAFRHNAVALGGGKVFCIDRGPGGKGKQPPRLSALDINTGREIWGTSKNVFGTWLSWSEKHDVLLQAGRPSRDMLYDEPRNRVIAYRGRDGTVLWDKPHRYNGPLMLRDKTILAQGNGFELLTGAVLMRTNPLTGLKTPWSFARDYGCNTAVASVNLLTFRSAAAGYFDLEHDGGTGNFGGFKSGCTSNLLAADGVLNAPDYTRTCTCGYPLQTSLALVHMPEGEIWTYNKPDRKDAPVKRLGLNFGAPGDRRTADGTLWLEWPLVGGPTPKLSVAVTPEECRTFRRHSSRVGGKGLPWVGASGFIGVQSLSVLLSPKDTAARRFTVRLYFVEPEGLKAGERRFDVAVQGKTVLHDFDIAAAAGGPNLVVVKEFRGVMVKERLTLSFTPGKGAKNGTAVLCGLKVAAE